MKKGIARLAVEYSVYFILLTFLHYTEFKLGVRAFALPFYCAAVYNKRNVIILSPLFIASAVIAEPTVNSLIIAAAPVAVALILLFIMYKGRIKMKASIMAAATALSMLPRAFLETGNAEAVIRTVTGAVCAELFFFVFVSLQYLLLRKRFEFPLTKGELVALAAFGAVIGLGMGYPEVYVFKFYYPVAVYALILSASAGRSVPLFLGGALATGVCLSGGAETAFYTVLYALCIALTPAEYAYFGGVIGVASEALLMLAGFTEASYLSLVMPAVGVAIGVVTPKKVKDLIRNALVTDSGYTGARTIINRNRNELKEKLNELGSSLNEIAAVLGDDDMEEAILDYKEIAKSISEHCCNGCPNEEKCKTSLRGGSTEEVIGELVKSALDSGRASILNASPFLSARCVRLNGVISATNAVMCDKESVKSKLKGGEECKELLRNQLRSLADILSRLALVTGEPLAYDGNAENKIKAALNSRLIGVREAYVYGDTVSLCVREGKEVERKTSETLSKVLDKRMTLVSSEPTINGLVALTYDKAPEYRVAYGERVLAAGEEGSGDKERVIRLTRDKVMLVLADGMGHDAPASRNARYAVKLIESFYRAGFDHSTVLESVGNLLSLRGREEFNAVDIAVIDTATGVTDVIKQGARESFILRKGEVEVLECGSLPLGIVKGAEPITHSVKLTRDAFLVLVSDGIIDAIGREELIDLLSGINTVNPDDIAEAVISNFRRLTSDCEERDDGSVIAARIF